MLRDALLLLYSICLPFNIKDILLTSITFIACLVFSRYPSDHALYINSDKTDIIIFIITLITSCVIILIV